MVMILPTLPKRDKAQVVKARFLVDFNLRVSKIWDSLEVQTRIKKNELRIVWTMMLCSTTKEGMWWGSLM